VFILSHYLFTFKKQASLTLEIVPPQTQHRRWRWPPAREPWARSGWRWLPGAAAADGLYTSATSALRWGRVAWRSRPRGWRRRFSREGGRRRCPPGVGRRSLRPGGLAPEPPPPPFWTAVDPFSIFRCPARPEERALRAFFYSAKVCNLILH